MYTQKIKNAIQALEELKTEMEALFVQSVTNRMYYHVKLREIELTIIKLENMLILAY